jgi:RNA polymerase sigma-70 factor (ECF subfamily)
VEERIEDKEQAMAIHRILHDLPEPYKEVFSLRVFGQLSFGDIGSLFGKTQNWACVTYHRARQKIREKMEE